MHKNCDGSAFFGIRKRHKKQDIYTSSHRQDSMSKEITKDRKSSFGVDLSGTPEDGQQVILREEDAIEKIFGTEHPELADGLLRHCFKVLKANEASDEYAGNDERSFMLGMVAEFKPRDTVERLLAVQMAAIHVAMVRSARWLANAETVDQVNAHSAGCNKLARTYAAQVETLRKHRNGGKQTVRVERVNVESGGQAVVGDVTTPREGCR